MTDHSLGGGDSSSRLDAAQADLNAFPTSNLYDGGCATCACEIPIVLTYEDGAPVPDAEFVVKWGEQIEGEEGEVIVRPTTSAQQAAPEIKGVVDANGLARVTNSPCGNYIVLFGEGSDSMEPTSLDKTSELYLAINHAVASCGVGTLTPRGRGELLWWLSAWLKEKAAEHMMQRIRGGDLSSKSEVVSFFNNYGDALWTEDGVVNDADKAKVYGEIEKLSLEDIATDSYWINPLSSDGPLVRLEEALEERREDLDYPDDDNAEKVARSLERTLVNGSNIPNEQFYLVLQNVKQAEQVAAQLVDPNEAGSWDVFLLVAEAALGFIPGVGDIMDVVDIIKWLYGFSTEDKTPGTWDYVELGALSLGFIPAIGIVLKKTFAPIARFFANIRGVSRVTGSASELLQTTIQVLRKLGDGNLIQWLIRKKNSVKDVIVKLKEMMNGLCESVIGALTKYIDNSSFWSATKSFAQRFLDTFTKFRDSIDDYLDPFFHKVDDMIASFVAKIANRFVGSAGKNIDPTVFKLRRTNANGSGGLGARGNGDKLPDGVCPFGMRQAMGSNPINMILGQPFQQHIDFSAGLFSLERCWTPGQGGGLFGPLWSTPLSSYVSIDADGANFQTAMGRKIPFDVPINGAVCANVHAEDYELIEYQKGYAVRDASNMLWLYEQHDGMVRRLSGVRDANDVGYDIVYAPDVDASIGLQPACLILTNGEIFDVEVKKGRLQRIVHRATQITEAQFEYDSRGLLVAATDTAGYRMGYGYDTHRRLVDLHYHNEHSTHYTYDNKNRVISVSTTTDFYHDRFEYAEPNSLGVRAVNFIDTLGRSKTTYINSDNDVIAFAAENGAITRYTYNGSGDIATETNPHGEVVEREWDTFGNLVKTLHPDGTEECFERDKRGRLLSFKDAAGELWEYERDEQGNIIAEHWPDGQSWRYQLNAHGQAVNIQNPDGSQLQFGYDNKHRLSHWRNALGAITTFAYDARDHLISRTDADGTTTQYEYDTAGRLLSAILANGVKLHWQWSRRGDLLKVVDGEGNVTRRDYGPYGLLKTVTDPVGGVVRFEHDRLMRLTGVINENREHYRYDYDTSSNVIREVDFSGRQLNYRYDVAGRLTEKIAGDGVKTTYSYALMNQLSQTEVFEKGEREKGKRTEFAYDARGLLITAKNQEATIELTRDMLGRVVCESLNGRTIESHYNECGQLESQDVNGRLTQYGYDANGLVSALGIGDHLPLRFERDVMGRERSRRSGAGFTEHSLWDVLGQLKAQVAGRGEHLVSSPHLDPNAWHTPRNATGDVAAVRTYTYDKAFNPTAIADARWGATHYQYNANSQVTHVKNDNNHAGLKEERFTYDAARNIEQSEQLTVDSSLSLLKEPPQHTTRNRYRRTPGGRIERRGNSTYAYDAQGRMVSKRTDRDGFRPQYWRYEWDGEDQLQQVTTPENGVWRYRYDPFGRRIGKTCIQPGSKRYRQVTDVHYLWSGNLLSEEHRIYADGTEQTVAYHYEQDSFRPIAQEVDGKLTYIVTDHLGTPKELLTEAGDMVWSARHELWGKITANQQAANDDTHECLLRFQGQIEDKESGFYYNRFRYYEPNSGNYLSSDPIGLAGGTRPHSYVANSASSIDPFGLKADCPGGSLGRDDGLTLNNEIVGGVPNGYAGHHMISVKIADQYSVMHKASEMGYNINRGSNGIALPTTSELAIESGLPLHNGRHLSARHPGSADNFVHGQLAGLQSRYDLGQISDGDLLSEISKVEDGIRDALVSNQVRLQSADPHW